ncbi:MAG: hypothetical protein ACYTGP_01480 [Planctomycetota bacterium]|jgi:hypothetical protein
MNKLAVVLCVAVAGGASFLVGARGQDWPDRRRPEPTDQHYWEKYFRQREHRTFSLGVGDDAFAVRFVANAPEPFPGPGHPAISVDHPRADRWIHVVELNCTGELANPDATGPTWHLTASEPPWIFVDTTDGNRAASVPFYWDASLPESQQRRFFDNPQWESIPRRDLWPDGYRKWEGRLYAVTVDDRAISLVGGIHWGLVWYVDEPQLEAIYPTRLSARRWNEDVALLSKVHPDWEFRKAAVE